MVSKVLKFVLEHDELLVFIIDRDRGRNQAEHFLIIKLLNIISYSIVLVQEMWQFNFWKKIMALNISDLTKYNLCYPIWETKTILRKIKQKLSVGYM